MYYNLPLSPTTDSYTHTIAANGGFISATIGLKMERFEIDDWLENGLGRHISVYNPGGNIIWEGFVNDITATIGGLTVKRGPLMGVSNKVRVVYGTLDTSVTPPTVGVRTKSAFSSDTTSQGLYAIHEKILSIGGCTETMALEIRDTYIGENARAETTPTTIVIGGTGSLTMVLGCRGYVDFLSAYTYNSNTTGDVAISTRIQSVISADPNSIISTDYTDISANTETVPSYEADDPLAYNYIMGMVAQGDVGYDRYTFGVYTERKAKYSQIPDDESYIWRISNGGEIYTPSGVIVRPWDVLPARWVHIPDFMIGRISDGTVIRDDPRYMFIESLTYTAPYSLTLTGAKISKLPQILGQLGLMGIGA
jgi:hypothetical protein